MSYYRLFISLALIVLLIPAGTAWAGASEEPPAPAQLCSREGVLRHICQGGASKGKPCTVEFNSDNSMCESSDCPGQCVVVYETKPDTDQHIFVPGTLTIIADDQFIAQGGNRAAAQQTFVARTILLRVTEEDGTPHFFTDTAITTDTFTPLEERLVNFNPGGRNDVEGLRTRFLFRSATDEIDAKGDFANALRKMFHASAESIPVIENAWGPIITSAHRADPLGSVLSFEIEIGFACDPDESVVCQVKDK